jgi:hypothetical protein
MSTKTPKPRVMWATRESGEPEHLHRTKADAAAWDYAGGYDARADSVYRVAVIPLSDTEAIVERARKAFFANTSGEGIRAALTAAGIPCLKRKARK